MATKLLLIEDIEALGRSGEIVSVKPGYARNFLLPQGFAIIADKRALRQQERLKEERQKRAVEDKKESDAVSQALEGISLVIIVKVDHEGHMYGSVTSHEIAHLLEKEHKIVLEKKNILIKHPIKTTGAYTIQVKLKEGVTSSFQLKVLSEEEYRASQQQQG